MNLGVAPFSSGMIAPSRLPLAIALVVVTLGTIVIATKGSDSRERDGKAVSR